MSLKLKVPKIKDGVTIDVTFWKIVEFYAKPPEKYFTCVIRGFKTEQDYIDYVSTGEKKDELRFEFSLSGTDYPDTTKKDWLSNKVEEYIKTQNKYGIDWTKATKEAK